MRTGISAADIMSSNVITAASDMTLVEAAKVMNKYRLGGLPVLKNNKLVGIITERCIMKRVIAKNKLPGKVRVKEIMVPKTKLIIGEKHEDIDSIAQKMARHDLTRIPILADDKLVGIITNRDILQHSSEHINILLEQARIKGPKDKGPHYPLAHGKCEKCGASGNLAYNAGEFLCELCL